MERTQDIRFWDRFSILLAHTSNLHRAPKSKPVDPSEMNVYDENGRLKRPKITKGPDFVKSMQAWFPSLKEGPK